MNFLGMTHPTLSDIDEKMFATFQASPPERGRRHETVFCLAAYFLGHELPANIVTSILELWNATRLKEPLPQEQIRYIVYAAKKTRRNFPQTFS